MRFGQSILGSDHLRATGEPSGEASRPVENPPSRGRPRQSRDFAPPGVEHPQATRRGLGGLPEWERFGRMPTVPENVAHMDGRLAKSRVIAECPSLAFGFAKIADDPLELSERKE